ncbi:phosphate signaling complex protein PhoU [Alkalibaculum sp. M08DMB]|uniref:Phosphate-specific transport system accessory protein PhoU n=1 Tax=Alkalibaculum sporogenes TaxID=2655001 RepID=A0A6A7K924_9FIRM|nr:phosphate signaling complex protein PhoU [Alkalibaculum sporogenes]MPW26009.1 phosphate signaling complex protein PhoU [Alkalibaculum sporogenes]
MVHRKGFDSELDMLHKEILVMSSIVEQMLRDSIIALKDKNIDLAINVIQRDDLIDKKEIDIQELCVLIIATQQPVAKDLRIVTSAFKIISNLERIADHAVNISEITIKLRDQKYFKSLIDIPKLSDMSIELIKLSIDAYVNLDISNMDEIIQKENAIDNLFRYLYRELVSIMIKDPQVIEQASSFIFVSSYLERVADHGINIFESINYIVTGNYLDL